MRPANERLFYNVTLSLIGWVHTQNESWYIIEMTKVKHRWNLELTKHNPYVIEAEWRMCVSKLTTIGSDNGLSPRRRQAIIWTNAGIFLIGPLGTNFSEILIVIYTFSFTKMHLKMTSGKWGPFYLGLNVLTHPHRQAMAIKRCLSWRKLQIL